MSKTFRIGATLGALGACTLLSGPVAYAQSASFSGNQTVYTQNFNSLLTTGSEVSTGRVPGLVSSRAGVSGNDIVAGTGSDNQGALYNFATSTTTGDRALGSLASSGTGTIFYGLRLQNNTGATITEFNLSYFGEQYRNGGSTSANQTDFSYLVTNTTPFPLGNGFAIGTYTDVNALDFISPSTGGMAREINGNLATNQQQLSATQISTIVAGQSPNGWQNGQYLYLRWSDEDDSGGGDHGLAIDEVRVEIPEPGPLALALLGTGPLGALVMKRRRQAG